MGRVSPLPSINELSLLKLTKARVLPSDQSKRSALHLSYLVSLGNPLFPISALTLLQFRLVLAGGETSHAVVVLTAAICGPQTAQSIHFKW